jgi:hypothetical protein
MPLIILLYFLQAQHVSGTTMSIIKSSNTIMFITTLVVSLCKDGRGSVSVKLWFLVVYVRCGVLCRSVVAGNVFLLILIVVILCMW